MFQSFELDVMPINFKPSSHDVVLSESIKIIMVGASGVGKTSILDSYIKMKGLDPNGYGFNTKATIDLSQYMQYVSIRNPITNKNIYIKVLLWDTAGQERYRSLITSYLRAYDCAIVVYDVNVNKSMDELKFWYELVLEYRSSNKIPIAFLGNKIDLQSKEEILHQKNNVNDIVYENSINVFIDFCSAKDGLNVSNVFVRCIKSSISNNDRIKKNIILQLSDAILSNVDENNNYNTKNETNVSNILFEDVNITDNDYMNGLSMQSTTSKYTKDSTYCYC
jgi:small GTP-binding protein